MTLSESLDNKIFDLPLPSTEYFPDYLRKVLEEYLSILKLVDDEYKLIIDKYFLEIEKTCKEILEITDLYFKGNSAHAYANFATTISRLEPYLTYPNKNVVHANPTYLFKARKGGEEQLGMIDMFHVPFEKRYVINTNRFSIPGVPCLYLANSIYTCWEELDRPLFSQMPVSRYELTGKNFKFLDLSNSVDFIKSSLFRAQAKDLSHLDLVKEYVFPRFLNAYPLFAACYIRVNNKTAIFKPEYIFPQMLMQWIMGQEDIDGVQYLSTKLKHSRISLLNLEDFLNFAIPVRSYKKTGYCTTLSKLVRLTEPITWELLNIIDPMKASKAVDFKEDIKNKFHVPPILRINLMGDTPTSYLSTAFGILEHQLQKAPAKEVLQEN